MGIVDILSPIFTLHFHLGNSILTSRYIGGLPASLWVKSFPYLWFSYPVLVDVYLHILLWMYSSSFFDALCFIQIPIIFLYWLYYFVVAKHLFITSHANYRRNNTVHVLLLVMMILAISRSIPFELYVVFIPLPYMVLYHYTGREIFFASMHHLTSMI